MEKFSDLQEKEVINICDGRRLGFVGDLELDIPSGEDTYADYPLRRLSMEPLWQRQSLLYPLAMYPSYRGRYHTGGSGCGQHGTG